MRMSSNQLEQPKETESLLNLPTSSSKNSFQKLLEWILPKLTSNSQLKDKEKMTSKHSESFSNWFATKLMFQFMKSLKKKSFIICNSQIKMNWKWINSEKLKCCKYDYKSQNKFKILILKLIEPTLTWKID